ncbi:WD_REPEATS_REGION domain-containing protein, partial [Haematococcus lacustris]
MERPKLRGLTTERADRARRHGTLVLADGAVLLHVPGSTDTLAELSAPEVANGRTAHHTGGLAKRSLCFSPLEPSLLAAASDDGGVHLWSIRGERPQHYALARRHAGPVAGVSFSTASAPLLFSCGADGQVLMWDRRAGEGAPEVQRALLPSRLSCMAMRDDGVTMAVGAT